jgi:formylglycine-generating enzyme required for sulfatase activity
MGRSEAGTDAYTSGNPNETPEHDAVLSSFALDKYEVTVGRFRKFVEGYDAWHVAATPINPATGAGTHPIAEMTGWGESWTPAATDLPANAAALMTLLNCNSNSQTWSDAAGTNTAEAYPINCVTWYEAFAFCVWDGGRLPTEAEWEFVAAGGAQNRLYPWGLQPPDSTRAVFTGSGNSPRIVVGSKQLTGGAGYFNHADLAGLMDEWVFDWYDISFYNVPCNDCANAARTAARVVRGGAWSASPAYLRAAYRHFPPPTNRVNYVGFRCARMPQ